ncbi:tyrosine-type recombinase/integrase [Escherichia coli]|uniref:tyrosine-type recombinase/integrase n=2 Tax=Escherichia coli TaxID=562 RepID=UPI001DDF6783|nr:MULTISPECIES: tyrosine-type recombinase/integrase [Enterobacterales]EFN6654558.1 DUF4102 domain-containing protein [Escherichia coli O166:H6]EFN6737878.1 DUF4102 domain-containing protein [Escherichia coli H6]MDE8641939.1 tyrosine-type recombinase/integrase [Proteus mirabilis]
MRLTDVQIRTIKYDPSRSSELKLTDGKGLYLAIKKTKKVWCYEYRKPNKKSSKRKLTMGDYPEITLAEARRMHAEARKLLSKGIDPADEKQRLKRLSQEVGKNTFGVIARDWFNLKSPNWSDNYRQYIEYMFERDIMPEFENWPISQIAPTDIITLVKKIEKRGALELAKKTRQRLSEIFRYAKVIGKVTSDPTADLTTIFKKHESKHYAFLLANELPEFLKAVSNYGGDILTKNSLKLLMLTGVRTIDIRRMEWSEIDFNNETWFLSGEKRSKRGDKKRDVTIALSKQAINILREIQPLTGRYKLVFPNRNNPENIRSENTILKMISNIGYKGKMTGHGFRHTLSTILNEQGYNSDWIEMQLAHVDGNNIRGTYNHANYLHGRRNMMQWYANYLDSLEYDSNVIPVEFSIPR